MTCDVADIAYFEFYDNQQSQYIPYVSASGKNYECIYYSYYPKDMELTEDTPVIAYVTHGGGVADEERALALNFAASFGTEALFIVPWTDRPEAVCAAIEAAKADYAGKGDFDNISIHGTSSGGRAVIRAAQKSVDPEEDYSFRFANIFAYDPINETHSTNITGNTEAFEALAEKGTVLLIQTDNSRSMNSGTGYFCNYIAEVYSNCGGTALIAEINSGGHEDKFTKPLSHNSISWAIGESELIEDEHYFNDWYYYLDGAKTLCDLEKANDILSAARGEEPEPTPAPTPRILKVGRTKLK